MVEFRVNHPNQNKQETPRSGAAAQENFVKDSASTTLVDKERAKAAPEQDTRFQTLTNTRQTQAPTGGSALGVRPGQLQRSRTRQRRQETPRKDPARENRVGAETAEHELSEQIAMRAANYNLANQATQRAATARQRQQVAPGAAEEERRIEEESSQALSKRAAHRDPNSPAAADAPSGAVYVAPEDFAIDTAAAQSIAAAPGDGLTASGPADQPAQGPSAQPVESQVINIGTEKLIDVVGPEATLTFIEKLRQVWVVLDEGAASELDVRARMPANLFGASAMDLLLVESPQGIHFVAFLRNRNDFDILATFDRRALLPGGDPSRQLIEAAVMSYEQLIAVFKDGCQKIGEDVAQLAASRSKEDVVLTWLRERWVKAKRRRKEFERMIDYWLDELDRIDEEQLPPIEATDGIEDLSADKQAKNPFTSGEEVNPPDEASAGSADEANADLYVINEYRVKPEDEDSKKKKRLVA